MKARFYLLFISFFSTALIAQNLSLPGDSIYNVGRLLSMNARDTTEEREAIRYLLIALQKAEEKNDTLLTAKCHHVLAYSFEEIDQQKGDWHLEKAIEIYKYFDRARYFEMSSYLAYSLGERGKFQEGIEHFQKIIEEAQALNEYNIVAESISELGYLYDRMKDYPKSIKLNREALQIATDSVIIARILGTIGIGYDELEQYDSAIYYNSKAISIFKRIKDERYAGVWLSNLGNTYVKVKEYNKALVVLKEAEQIQNRRMNTSSTLLANIGRAYFELGEQELSIDYYYKSLTAARNVENKRAEEEVEYFISLWYEKYGKLEDALFHFRNHVRIKDSLYNLERVKEASELQLKYETSIKDKMLAEQKLELAESNQEIQRRNFLALALVILVLVIGLVGFLIVRVQIQKRKRARAENERIITEQKLSISRDLHDNIGSQITFLINSIEGASYVAKDLDVKAQLDQLSEFGREAMSDLRNTVWVMKQEEGDLQTLYSKLLEIKAKISSIPVEISPLSGNFKLNSTQLLNTYRIAQESIQNALKHSNATKIHVEMSSNTKGFSLVVSDDGIGFDMEDPSKGSGLANMKERAKKMNAELTIESIVGSKTTIKLSVNS